MQESEWHHFSGAFGSGNLDISQEMRTRPSEHATRTTRHPERAKRGPQPARFSQIWVESESRDLLFSRGATTPGCPILKPEQRERVKGGIPQIFARDRTAPTRVPSTDDYEVSIPVCIDSRSSRLLWGSGNARQNRTDTTCNHGARFPNRDTTNVGVLENRSIVPKTRPKSPTPSTGRDAQCAIPLWWIGGNTAPIRIRSTDQTMPFSTTEDFGPTFAAYPQTAAGCGTAS